MNFMGGTKKSTIEIMVKNTVAVNNQMSEYTIPLLSFAEYKEDIQPNVLSPTNTLVEALPYAVPRLAKSLLVVLWIYDFLFTLLRYSAIFISQNPGYLGPLVPIIATHFPVLIILGITLPLCGIVIDTIRRDKAQKDKTNLKNLLTIARLLKGRVANDPKGITYEITAAHKLAYPQLQDFKSITINDSGIYATHDPDSRPSILSTLWDYFGTASYAYWILFGFGFVLTQSLGFLACPWLFLVPFVFPVLAVILNKLTKLCNLHSLTEGQEILAAANLDLTTFLAQKLQNSENKESVSIKASIDGHSVPLLGTNDGNKDQVVNSINQERWWYGLLIFIVSWVSMFNGIQFIAWLCMDCVNSLAAIKAIAAVAGFLSIPLVATMIGWLFIAGATFWAIKGVADYLTTSKEIVQNVTNNTIPAKIYDRKQKFTASDLKNAAFDFCYYMMTGILVVRFLLLAKTAIFLPWVLLPAGFCLPLVVGMVAAGVIYATIKMLGNYKERAKKDLQAEYIKEVVGPYCNPDTEERTDSDSAVTSYSDPDAKEKDFAGYGL